MSDETGAINRGERTYVLMTPARNEEAYIEKTIQSVISQTVLPKKWVIVSDGSTDRTDEIVEQYLPNRDWIELVRMPEHKDRHFAAKAECLRVGHQRLKDTGYEIIGSLDADISFEEDYFEFLLEKFGEIPELGVAGTPFAEDSSQSYDYRFVSTEHVSGACQVFRRECFEAVGGYVPISVGGIDWMAVTTARMKGWKTRTFVDKVCFHHRRIGTGSGSAPAARFRYGQKDYCLGSHPLWEVSRSLFQITARPYVIGGLLLLSGYVWALLSKAERPLSQELIKFHRKEQMDRLKDAFRNAARLIPSRIVLTVQYEYRRLRGRIG